VLSSLLPSSLEGTSSTRPIRSRDEAQIMLDQNVKAGELVVPQGTIFAMGDNRDEL